MGAVVGRPANTDERVGSTDTFCANGTMTTRNETTDSADYRHDERFRKAERLLERDEFLAARREGRRASTGNFVVYARDGDRRHARLGITASTSVGPANVRNWWKRRIREVFRRNKGEYPQGFDYVVIVRPTCEKAHLSKLRNELLGLLRRTAGSSDE